MNFADLPLPARVRVGGKTKSELLAGLQEHGVQLNQAALDLFSDDRFMPHAEPEEIGIAAFSVRELGFPDGATTADLLDRAGQRGLEACPLELAAYLRLEPDLQPEIAPGQSANKPGAPAGALNVVSPRLDDADETPKGFYLRQIDGVAWLRGYWASLDHVWDAEDIMVYARRPGNR